MSGAGQSELTDDVTVLVFKDNYSARTFQIPLGWVSRFGFILGILSGITLLTTFFAIKFYRATRHLDPTHVQDLEQELSELRAKSAAVPVPVPAPTAAAAPAPAATSTTAEAAQPVPTVTVTVTAAPPPAPPAQIVPAAPAGAALAFSALPASVQPWPAGAKLPISIGALHAEWQGKTLKVHFNIQYINDDGGSQQGHILVLARGPETLLAYPDGALGPVSSGALLVPEKGEYFSVSRFREVKADFGPLRSPKAIQEAEILLVSHDGKLLAHQTIAPAPPKAAPAPSPALRKPRPAAPAASKPDALAKPPGSPDSELIGPGVDQ